jgi:hypothetical protein
MANPKFTIVAKVRGDLISSYVFENRQEYDNWLRDGFEKLQRQYGNLTVSKDALHGLTIGDECNVWGEGDEVFEITNLVKIEDHRWSFVLNSGWKEEVAKCHTSYLREFNEDDRFGF